MEQVVIEFHIEQLMSCGVLTSGAGTSQCEYLGSPNTRFVTGLVLTTKPILKHTTGVWEFVHAIQLRIKKSSNLPKRTYQKVQVEGANEVVRDRLQASEQRISQVGRKKYK